MYICLRESEQVPYFIINLAVTPDVYFPIGAKFLNSTNGYAGHVTKFPQNQYEQRTLPPFSESENRIEIGPLFGEI